MFSPLISLILQLMILLHLEPQLSWKLVIALLAHRLEVNLKKLGFGTKNFVTGGATEVMRTPGFA